MHARVRHSLWLGFALIPLTARADGIDLPLVAGIGIGVAVPLLAFNVVVEGLILSRFIGVRIGNLWRPLLMANVWSLLAGLPVNILNAFLAEVFLPREMISRIGLYPFAISLGIVNYYVVTVAVEYWALRRRGIAQQARRSLLKGLLAGHIVSYAVLGPLLVWYATPKSTVQAFTKNSRWAAHPATPIVFISPKNQLQAALSDGGRTRTLVADEVRDFVISADLNTVLFRGISNRYRLVQGGTTQLVVAEPIRCYGRGMDFSPAGRFVGLVDELSTLWLWDGQSGRIRKQALPKPDSFDHYELVWSTNENVFHLAEGHRPMKGAITDGDLSILWEPMTPKPAELVRHYGRVGRQESNADDWDAPADWMYSDGDRGFFVEHGLGNGIFAHVGTQRVSISDNPGILHFGDRRFVQAAFALSRTEIVFDDGNHLYLADIPARKVGLITAGKRFVLLSPAFSKAETFGR